MAMKLAVPKLLLIGGIALVGSSLSTPAGADGLSLNSSEISLVSASIVVLVSTMPVIHVSGESTDASSKSYNKDKKPPKTYRVDVQNEKGEAVQLELPIEVKDQLTFEKTDRVKLVTDEKGGVMLHKNNKPYNYFVQDKDGHLIEQKKL